MPSLDDLWRPPPGPSQTGESIYDRRTTPAYRDLNSEPNLCENPHILNWWSDEHDSLLCEEIQRWQWDWYWSITDRIVAITPPTVIKAWRSRDPLCKRYAWNNVLMRFAASRANKIGLNKAIREPRWKACLICRERFIESSLPFPFIRRLGINQLDFCSPCLKKATLDPGNKRSSRQQVIRYLQDLTSCIQQIPSQGWGSGMDDLAGLTIQERLAALQLLREKPSVERVKKLFGSWFAALVDAGVLGSDAQRMLIGTRCLAKDGHVCFSLGEKTIDDLLYALGIAHQKEPRYPEGALRADFSGNGVFVEYLGLAGDPEYDAKTEFKQRLCEKYRMKLILLYPADLVSPRKLKAKLLEGLSGGSRSL